MKNLFKKNLLLTFTISIISILLAINLILTNNNNSIIKRNQAIQEDVANVKMYYDQIGKAIIHSLDIGLRGYAIVRTEKFSAPMDNARNWKDSILSNTENYLRRLKYDLTKYRVFKDSLDAYERYCFDLKQLLTDHKDEEFVVIFKSDAGGYLWFQYIELEKDIQHYVNAIHHEAQAEYEQALRSNFVLQLLIFVICFPTLIYTAVNTARNFQLSEMIRKSEKEKNKILVGQKAILEHRVVERTQEIASQNEEITSQREELAAQRDILLHRNKQLQLARDIIEKKNEEIEAINRDLKEEVNKQTFEIQNANKELIQQNTQLEQFAFIVAHNLRAPLARVLGLTHLIKISEKEADRQVAFEKLEESTADLDHVIKDLTSILNIKKHTSNLTEVDLEGCFVRVKRMLEKEIEETQATISEEFLEVRKVYAVPAYVESILYNLISNGIKYRDPERLPFVRIYTKIKDNFVCMIVKDNGLGIDLKKHKSNMFNLYKRFHLHMEGKGLGLFLVKTQIEALGGKIEVQSELNEGTTFSVYFKRSL